MGDLVGRAGWQGGRVAEMPPGLLLRQHWQALREGDDPPRRNRIAPRVLAPMLEHSLLIERDAGGAVMLRHAGLMVCAVHGQELVGRPLSVLFETGTRTRMLEAVEGVLSGRQTVEMALYSERGFARPPLRGRLTLLPLIGPSTEEVAAIGCLELEGPPVLPPRRFRIERVLGEPLGRAQGAREMRPRPATGPVLVWSR